MVNFFLYLIKLHTMKRGIGSIVSYILNLKHLMGLKGEQSPFLLVPVMYTEE
jgi:hypothetical protein